MNRLIKILQTRFAGIFCFSFAIANRIIFASLYSIIGVDTKSQLAQAKNLLAGKGLGITKYFTNDLSTPVFDTHQYYPPGFSVVVIPFLKIFGGDENNAVLAYDIAVAILFVIAVRLLGKKAGLSPALNNIVTLIAGCFQYIFFMAWSTTDAICVCLTIFGLIETVKIINKKENIGLLRMGGTGLLFFSPFFFRYMYMPLVLLFPLLILLSGIFFKSKPLKDSGLKVLASSAFVLILFCVFSLTISGNALHVTGVDRGLFFDQFADCYPFLPASFINLDFAAQLIERVFDLEYSRVMFYFKVINPILLAVFLFLLWRYLKSLRRYLQIPTHSLFIIIGSIISITILLLLSWLTLTYKGLSWGFHTWTFVGENRYFAFIYVFIPVLLFISIHHYRSSFKRPVVLFFVVIGFCCLATEVLHGLYYNAKILLSHKDLLYIREGTRSIKAFPAMITEIKNQNPGKDILVTAKDQFYLHIATEMGCKSIFDFDTFLKTDLKVPTKSILIMPINTGDVIIIEEYIEKKKLRLAGSVSGISFYTQEIDP